MRKKYANLFFMAFILVFTAISCRFPFKIVPNLPETTTPTASFTPQPSSTTQPPTVTVQSTPTPENNTSVMDLDPEKGSRLTWMDYSSFVYIPGGDFIIGKDSYNPTDFSPSHQVTLTSFWIQQAEVTNQQYAQCVSDGRCSLPIQEPEIPYWYENDFNGNHPVVGVTWFQAREYCTYIHARLPTEAEWEAAARGSEGKIYPWGGDKPNCNYTNFKGCLDPAEPIDILSYSFGASDFDVFDLSGNVFEWVSDWYAKDYYQSSPSQDPIGPLDGRKKVYRGGSYRSSTDEMGAFLRFALEPEKQSSDIGFRCVLEGNPITDAALQIGQSCSISGMSDPNQIQPTSTPFPCAAASVSGYCQLLSGKPSYGVEINQSGCLDNNLYSMMGNSQPLTCTIFQLSNGGKKYQCTFPGMGQGVMVDVSYCNLLDVPLVEITCPIGYQLDQTSRQCELINTKLPAPPCPNGYQEIPSYGCLPKYDPAESGCPIGYYSLETTGGFVCMPLNKCDLSIGSESCANTICAAGQRYDEFKNCCASGNSPKKNCANNLIYNADQNVCIEPGLYSDKCLTSNVKIPYCPTLTPTPTSIPVPQTDCSIFRDANTCLANGCQWKIGFTYCY